MSSSVLLRGGWVVDPSLNLNGPADVRFRNGAISDIGQLDVEPGDRVRDVQGLVVAPGLVDVHVHLREPGQESKETIGSGTAAAAAGGFTTIFCMPNTEPALDSVAALEELQRRVARDAVVRVRAIAAVSEGRRGEWAVDFDALAMAGAVGFSDDGESTKSSGVMRQALAATRQLSLPVMVHCEDAGLTGGSMHEGDISRVLNLRGLPSAAEEISLTRDLQLAALSGGWLHVCHVSTANGAASIAAAKRGGVRVTAEVMPHHLAMSDDWVGGTRNAGNAPAGLEVTGSPADPETKVNPPLRTWSDARQLLDFLRSGAIDVLATDHAPHAMPEKQGRAFEAAAFGFSGSEVALSSMLDFVRAGELTLSDVVSRFSTVPARLWNLDAGTLRPGSPADITVFDPGERWVVDGDQLRSRGSNTPLRGMSVSGRVKLTLVGGDVRYCD